MKRAFVTGLLAATLFAATFSAAQADTYVNGYYRNNGTYVAPHYRSDADSSYNNNWSVRPNVNPYTGRAGTHAPLSFDREPSRVPYSPPVVIQNDTLDDYIWNGGRR